MARDLTMWEDGARRDMVYVQRVDPHALDTIDGTVDALALDGCSITEGYYTDARSTASIRHMGSWDSDVHWLRIVHECPDYGYRAELGTFLVDKIEETQQDGMTTTDLSCRSVLWGLSEDMVDWVVTFGAGSTAHDAFRTVLRITGKEGTILPGAPDHRYGQTVVHDVGDTFLSDLFGIAESCGGRIDIDGHGRITLGAYVAPSRREPDWILDARSSRTIVLADEDRLTTSFGDAAGRSIVRHSMGQDSTIAASVDVEQGSLASPQRRGWLKASMHDASDMQPETWQRAHDLALTYIGTDSDVAKERQISCMYFPVHEGDIVQYADTSGRQARYLAKEVDVSLGDMTVKLTLREVQHAD